MPDAQRLRRTLDRIDGRPYPAYRDLTGSWELESVTLIVDRVQGDPFASPSRVRVELDARLPDSLDLRDRDTRLAVEDWLLRRFAERLQGERRGSGHSGKLGVLRPGPEVVERSALRVHPDGIVEVRFTVGLPARGRRILGRQASELLTVDVIAAAQRLDSTTWTLKEQDALATHVQCVQRQRGLRRVLADHGLVAFIENGSVLPRRSGVDPRPLQDAVPFQSPPTLEVTLEALGPVRGMGIRCGVTLIAGGGFHGKSTLLQALEQGHVDHVPGDGREGVVSDMATVKVRAEDGRRVERVDISAFLSDLPGGRSTAPFSTEDASGSTSQAAAIVEAAGSGARLLLLDEDTSATNLLVRDDRMRALIGREAEPITPLVERIRELYEGWGLSTVLVVGGVGDFLAVADVVVAMLSYKATDVTERARELAGPLPQPPRPASRPGPRTIERRGLEPGKVRARDDRAVRYGDGEIDLTAVDQVRDTAHALSIGAALRFLHDELLADRGALTLKKILAALDAILDDEGVEVLGDRGYPDGGLVRPTRHEIAAALNRHRSLVVHA
jgi:predicted ABC-class ATPase